VRSLLASFEFKGLKDVNIDKNIIRFTGSVALISMVVSGVTSITILKFLDNDSKQTIDVASLASLPTLNNTSIIECNQLVYSPIQNKCVSLEVFDGEMKNLFSALGIDTSIYSMKGTR
jgi:hypothetical protein